MLSIIAKMDKSYSESYKPNTIDERCQLISNVVNQLIPNLIPKEAQKQSWRVTIHPYTESLQWHFEVVITGKFEGKIYVPLIFLISKDEIPEDFHFPLDNTKLDKFYAFNRWVYSTLKIKPKNNFISWATCETAYMANWLFDYEEAVKMSFKAAIAHELGHIFFRSTREISNPFKWNILDYATLGIPKKIMDVFSRNQEECYCDAFGLESEQAIEIANGGVINYNMKCYFNKIAGNQKDFFKKPWTRFFYTSSGNDYYAYITDHFEHPLPTYRKSFFESKLEELKAKKLKEEELAKESEYKKQSTDCSQLTVCPILDERFLLC